ncbi:GIY-YIG nuclease family protein [Dongia sp. agr-C8]
MRLLSRNGDNYVGSTDDLSRRFGAQSRGEVTSTKAYLPVALKSYVAVPSKVHARQLEVHFKSGSGEAFAKKRLLR